VGTKKQAKPILEAEAKRARMPYVVNRWLGGTLTNFQTIKANIDRMRTLRKQRDDGFFERVSKKDAKGLTKELERLEEHFSGLADLEKLPGCLFVVDIKREDISVREANRLRIPIVAICDTNADPDLITYPIPGNDDAIRSIRLITSLVADSLLSGRQRYEVAQQPAVEPIERAEGDPEAASVTTQADTDEPRDAEAKKD
jgi:small subunit ribosomal protein S2